MKLSFTKLLKDFKFKSVSRLGLKTLLVILIFLTFNTNRSIAQIRQVGGLVVDEKGESLPGVNIKVKGSSKGTSTDLNGRYSLQIENSDAVLVFSYTGFNTLEIAIKNRKTVDATLLQSTINLNEVIVQTGYGSSTKRDLTGAVGSVSVVDLQKAPVRSFEEALAGRVAGVQVIAGDGQPGDGLDIVVRGNNSLNYSNSPLYVIDGFPIEDPDNNTINPDEIETIDVLKDASATAIYGSRGANGVIIITTKRGKLGAPVISYNGYYGFNSITDKAKLMDPYEFVKLQTEINPTTAANSYFTNGKTLETYRNVKPASFQDKVYGINPFQNHSVALRGGTESTKYSISGSLTNQDGLIVNSGFNRYQGRITLDQQVSKKFKVGADVNYASTKSYGIVARSQNTSGGNDVNLNLVYQIWAYRPITGSLNLDDLLDDFQDPEENTNYNRVNPFVDASNAVSASYNKNLRGNFYAEYKILPSLSLRSSLSGSYSAGRTERFYNSKTRQGSPLTTQGQTYGINGSIQLNEVNNYSNENVLTYTKKFNKNHQITANAIYSIQLNKRSGYGYRATNVPSESLGVSGLGESIEINPNSSSSNFRLLSYAGRINYQMYGGKYLFTGTFRADGSSKFYTGNKYGFFPSGAFAWRWSEEKFIRDLNFVSSGKFRIGYGVTGNNRVADFAYASTIGTALSVGDTFYPFNNQLIQAFYKQVLGNRDIKWESTGQFDTGLEFGVFKDRVLFEADYYKKDTYDLLLNSAIPLSTGFNTIIDNIGRTRNEGFELTVNSENIRSKNFSWNTSFNISFNRNRIVSLTNGQDNILSNVGGTGGTFQSIPGYIAKVGKPIASMYGFVYEGNYQISDFDVLSDGSYQIKESVPVGEEGFIRQTRTGSNRVQPGDPKYRDVNGDGKINDDDRTIIGNPYPIHVGGLNNNFKYKAFDLNVFLQWSYGNKTYNFNRLLLEGSYPLALNINQFASYTQRWTPENPNNEYIRVNATGAGVYSTRFLEDASFIRLKTVQLGYTLPAKVIKRLGFNTFRVYSSAQNLLTLTNYSSTDPENSTRGNGLTPGFDFSAYPRALTFTFGLNASF
nr:TonB-dependent receptor [uncultured Pedobacter sp.]